MVMGNNKNNNIVDGNKFTSVKYCIDESESVSQPIAKGQSFSGRIQACPRVLVRLLVEGGVNLRKYGMYH